MLCQRYRYQFVADVTASMVTRLAYDFFAKRIGDRKVRTTPFLKSFAGLRLLKDDAWKQPVDLDS